MAEKICNLTKYSGGGTEWTFLSETNLGEAVAPPSSFNEVLVEVINTADKNRFSFLIPRSEFDGSAKVYVNGGMYQSNNFTYVTASITANNTILGGFRKNGADTSTGIIKRVYYR